MGERWENWGTTSEGGAMDEMKMTVDGRGVGERNGKGEAHERPRQDNGEKKAKRKGGVPKHSALKVETIRSL